MQHEIIPSEWPPAFFANKTIEMTAITPTTIPMARTVALWFSSSKLFDEMKMCVKKSTSTLIFSKKIYN